MRKPMNTKPAAANNFRSINIVILDDTCQWVTGAPYGFADELDNILDLTSKGKAGTSNKMKRQSLRVETAKVNAAYTEVMNIASEVSDYISNVNELVEQGARGERFEGAKAESRAFVMTARERIATMRRFAAVTVTRPLPSITVAAMADVIAGLENRLAIAIHDGRKVFA